MRLIFLDCDGVLNRLGSPEQGRTAVDPKTGFIGLEPELVKRFKLIVERTQAAIVLSSSWRHYPDLRAAIKEAGINFFDVTPTLSGQERGEEIEAWIVEYLHNGGEISSYAIIDDDHDFLPAQPHFHTPHETGLTEEVAAAIETHLGFDRFGPLLA